MSNLPAVNLYFDNNIGLAQDLACTVYTLLALRFRVFFSLNQSTRGEIPCILLTQPINTP